MRLGELREWYIENTSSLSPLRRHVIRFWLWYWQKYHSSFGNIRNIRDRVKDGEMKIKKQVFLMVLLLAGIFGMALLFRVLLPYEQCFSGDGVIKFGGVDAYFYQRIIDNTVHNFPQLMSFDPYLLYPGGSTLTNIYFPVWLLSGFIWIIGLGSPSQHLIDTVSAYAPAIFTALPIFPIFVIGRALFNKRAGIIAAALFAVLPGEFLGRTVIGMNDTVGIEILLTATFMAFVILVIKTAEDRGSALTLKGTALKKKRYIRPVIYGTLAGLFLGLYLVSWMGALLFVFILAIYFIIRIIKTYLQG